MVDGFNTDIGITCRGQEFELVGHQRHRRALSLLPGRLLFEWDMAHVVQAAAMRNNKHADVAKGFYQLCNTSRLRVSGFPVSNRFAALR